MTRSPTSCTWWRTKCRTCSWCEGRSTAAPRQLVGSRQPVAADAWRRCWLLAGCCLGPCAWPGRPGPPHQRLADSRRCLPLPWQRADEIAAEKNRALKAALNADLRKTKATLLEQAIPLLEKMARKGKGLTPEKIQARLGLVRGRGRRRGWSVGAACRGATACGMPCSQC